MANVRVRSTSMIKASSPVQERKKIQLNPIDIRYLLVGPVQKGLLFQKPKQTQFQELINHLQTSLSRTLNFFFPLAGRLSTLHHQDNTISFFIDCNNAGALFIDGVAENVTVSDILEPTYFPPILKSFFPMNETKNLEAVSKPFLAVQVTELTDGAFIGFTISHSIADGTSFWHFINSWSEISRSNSDQISKIPVFDSWCHDEQINLPVSIMGTYDEFTPPLFQERIFHFSKEKIAELKAKANSSESENCEKIKLSSLQSLSGHVWHSIIRCRELDPEGETKFLFIISLRSKLQPPIPEGYFGNAIEDATVTVKVKDLVEQGVRYPALEMNKTIVSYTEEKMSIILEDWKKNPDIIRLGGYTRNTVILSSSPRFNVYGNDFGWGRPIAVRSGPSNKFDGMITAYEGIEEGGVDVEVCTSPQVLEALENDPQFMDAVTV